MSFLNPALVAALAGVLVPLLAHLIDRRRGRRVRFAALDFLLASERRLAARRRLMNVLLLLVRLALVAAAALAIARPIFDASAATGVGPRSLVAVLDRSFSTRLRDAAGEPIFEGLKRDLRDAIAQLPEGSEVALLTVDRPPGRITDGFVEPRAALAALAPLTAGHTRGDGAVVLAEAAALLERAALPRRGILVASDLQATSWQQAVGASVGELEVSEPRGSSQANRAVVALNYELESGERRLGARIGRWPAGAAEEQGVRLSIDGQLSARELVSLGAADEGAAFAMSLPGALAPGEVLELAFTTHDALPEDDARLLLGLERASLRVLAVNGSPGATLQADELFYFTSAVRARPEREPELIVEAIDGTLGRLPALDGYDVVLLANIEAVSEPEGAAIGEWVAAGGGLFVSLGARSDLERLNAALGPLLPGRLGAVEAGPGPVALVLPEPGDPIVAGLGGSTGSASDKVRIDRLVRVEPHEGSRVSAALPDGRALLSLKPHGKGLVALLATSLDRDWTDLPVRPLYLPVVERTLLELGGARRRGFQRDYLVGDAVAFPDDAGESLSIACPDGRSLVVPRQGADAVFAGTDVPGVYRAVSGDGRHFDFVVGVDPLESDLRRRAEPLVSGRVAARRERSELLRSATDLSGLLAMFALCALAAETLLGRYR